MKKRLLVSSLAVLSISFALGYILSLPSEKNEVSEAYSTSSLPKVIDLNAPEEEAIREYYSELDTDLTGLDILGSLKNILKNNQKYYGYDSSLGDKIWQMYEIIDRDWIKSPAEDIASYDSTTNKITNYRYGSSDPYIHALYVNRDVENLTTAWSDHEQTQWGINREHIWPKSQGFNEEGKGGARGDPMHLWAGNGRVNGVEHNNHPYGYVDTSKKYTDPVSAKGFTNLSGNLMGKSLTCPSSSSVSVFEPQDSDKGDIARAIFYMVARYNYRAEDGDTIDKDNPNLELVDYPIELASYTSTTSLTGKMGILSDLLEWNHIDPPDEFEIRRNNLLYVNYTNNRNPFIDFPSWADIIWGDRQGDEINLATDALYDFGTTTIVDVEGVDLEETASVIIDKSISLHASISPKNASNKKVTWESDNPEVATVNKGIVTGVSEGQANITVITVDGEFTATCVVNVLKDSRVFVTNKITRSSFKFAESGSGYKPWTDLVLNPGATYKGVSNTASYIQLNKTDSHAGIVSITSPGKIRKVSVEWNASNTDNHSFKIYGKNEAYTSTADLYDDNTKGDLLGSLLYRNGDNASLTTTVLEINGDYNYVGILAANAVYLDSITFDWEVPVESVSLDKNELYFDLANYDSIAINATVSPSNASNINIIWSSENEEVAVVDDGVVAPVGVGSTNIIATSEEGNKTASCMVTVVDTTSVDYDESPYINGVAYKMFLHYKDNNDYYFTGVDGYYGASSATYSLGQYVYFEKDGDGQNLYYNDGNITKYIYVELNGNYINFKTGTSKPSKVWKYSDAYECLYMTIDDVNYTIGNYGNYSKFTGGHLTGENKVITYRVQFKETADSYSYNFINSIHCDNTGRTAPLFDSGYSWSELKTHYLNLDTSEQEILSSNNSSTTNVSLARARYDYIVAKYTSDVYEDFMNRNPVLPSQNINTVFNITKNSDSIIYIIVFSSLTGLSFLLYLGIRKKED